MPEATHDPARGALPFAAGSVARTLEEAMLSRRSLRAFKPDPVPRATVERILALASRAPSGTNIQPWKVYVAGGAVRDRLAQAMHDAFMAHGEDGWKREYDYYPVKWRDPYLARRRKIGWDLYGLLGIGKADKAAMHHQHGRNYRFFDAPVGLIFTIDRVMRQGSWLDYGMFLQNIMTAARGRGLDTFPQAAFMQYHRIITEHIGAGPQQMVVCGMSLGHADPEATENRLVTEREPVAGFATFLE
jgi:nitroreductase